MGERDNKMTVYMLQGEWAMLKYKVAKDLPLPDPFYGEQEFGENERDEYVKLQIERIE